MIALQIGIVINQEKPLQGHLVYHAQLEKELICTVYFQCHHLCSLHVLLGWKKDDTDKVDNGL